MLHHIYSILWGENGLSSEAGVTQEKSISAKVMNRFIKPQNAVMLICCVSGLLRYHELHVYVSSAQLLNLFEIHNNCTFESFRIHFFFTTTIFFHSSSESIITSLELDILWTPFRCCLMFDILLEIWSQKLHWWIL